tara:strand:+ start:1099 stop:1605 length:507 start_codon:yes stop_codon:yes gene_type:complete
MGSLLEKITPDERGVVDKHRAQVPVRVSALAQELGLEIVLAALSPNISGMIEPSDTAANGYKIKINKFEKEERQRFTAAHEISHYLLHREYIKNGIVDSALYRSNLSSYKETQANKLAADILMPVEAVRAALNDLGGQKTDDNARVLASEFKVSVPAMKVRLGMGEYA